MLHPTCNRRFLPLHQNKQTKADEEEKPSATTITLKIPWYNITPAGCCKKNNKKKAHKKHRYNYNIDCWIEVITPVNMLEVRVNLLPNPSVIFPVQQGNTAMKLSSDYKSNFRSYAAIFLHIFPSVPNSLLLISYEHLSSKKIFIQHILRWWTENVKHVLLHPSASIILFLILW